MNTLTQCFRRRFPLLDCMFNERLLHDERVVARQLARARPVKTVRHVHERKHKINAPLRALKHIITIYPLVRLRTHPPTPVPPPIALEQLALLSAEELSRRKISRRTRLLKWPEVRCRARIALLNFSCSGRIAWMRPSSATESKPSGIPWICWARSWVNVCRRVNISLRGSAVGAGGRRDIVSRVFIIDCSSSS